MAIKAVFFDARDTLVEAEQGKQVITGAVLDEAPLLTIGDFIAADDINIISHTGPADITPYVALVGEIERVLGIGAR